MMKTIHLYYNYRMHQHLLSRLKMPGKLRRISFWLFFTNEMIFVVAYLFYRPRWNINIEYIIKARSLKVGERFEKGDQTTTFSPISSFAKNHMDVIK